MIIIFKFKKNMKLREIKYFNIIKCVHEIINL